MGHFHWTGDMVSWWCFSPHGGVASFEECSLWLRPLKLSGLTWYPSLINKKIVVVLYKREREAHSNGGGYIRDRDIREFEVYTEEKGCEVWTYNRQKGGDLYRALFSAVSSLWFVQRSKLEDLITEIKDRVWSATWVDHIWEERPINISLNFELFFHCEIVRPL